MRPLASMIDLACRIIMTNVLSNSRQKKQELAFQVTVKFLFRRANGQVRWEVSVGTTFVVSTEIPGLISTLNCADVQFWQAELNGLRLLHAEEK